MSDKEMNMAIENKLQHTFEVVSFMIKSIVAFDSVDTLYLGMSSSHAAVAANSLGNIYLLMPAVYEDRGYSIDTRYVTFDIDVLEERANEHQTSEKCTERTITPLANENVSECKETASTAKVVAIYIGVPVCLDIPPNNMRLDIAANKPLNAAVGDCLCGVGKVVHTLPLPPPWSEGMSKITKVNQLIKKQKWKRIFVYLADLHSEMANAIDL